jgi:hypothetical protein
LLQQITKKFGAEKIHWQFHKFYKEIGNKRNVYAHTYAQQCTPSHKIKNHAAKKQHKLSNKHNPYKTYLLPFTIADSTGVLSDGTFISSFWCPHLNRLTNLTKKALPRLNVSKYSYRL